MAQSGSVLFSLGFRPFFLVASWFSVIAMLIWTAIYSFGLNISMGSMSPIIWHGHEMIFGYSSAVLAGFLLTSVRNWTGLSTPDGAHLIFMVSCWVIARIAFLIGTDISIIIACITDLLFMQIFVVGVTVPIVAAKQWKQLSIVIKLVLLLLSNALFYAGLLGYIAEGVRWGLYSGLFMVLAVILVLARRVFPFFVSMATSKTVTLKNYMWLDRASIALFFGLWIAAVFIQQPIITALFAVSLTLLHGIRMYGWYTSAIWSSPLLWVIYLAYSFIVLGFALQTLTLWLPTQLLSTHSFAVGGIGLITLGMMTRVTLGHTGRNVYAQQKGLTILFSMLICSALVRVLLPLLLPVQYYSQLVLIAQILWVASYLWFAIIYTPFLWKPRLNS